MQREVASIGTFPARASAADLSKSSQKGTPCVDIEFEVTRRSADGVDEVGARIRTQLWLTEAALARTVESLRHTGWQGDDLSDLSTVGSKECAIVVVEDEYRGQIRLKVAYVNALGADGLPTSVGAMSPEEKKAFAARMRGQVIAASGGKPSAKPAPKPAAPRPAPSQDPTDDIGF